MPAGRPPMRGMPRRMTAAEFQIIREYLGLTRATIAGVLGVREGTVQAWEQGRDPIPYRVREEIAALEQSTDKSVTEVVDQLRINPVATVYRSGKHWEDRAAPVGIATLGERWWRHVVARAVKMVPGEVEVGNFAGS